MTFIIIFKYIKILGFEENIDQYCKLFNSNIKIIYEIDLLQMSLLGFMFIFLYIFSFIISNIF